MIFSKFASYSVYGNHVFFGNHHKSPKNKKNRDFKKQTPWWGLNPRAPIWGAVVCSHRPQRSSASQNSLYFNMQKKWENEFHGDMSNSVTCNFHMTHRYIKLGLKGPFRALQCPGRYMWYVHVYTGVQKCQRRKCGLF